MTHETAIELVKYYLMDHGAACGKTMQANILLPVTKGRNWLSFIFRGRTFEMGVWGEFIDVGCGGWFDVNLEYSNVDETNPAFDPEVFFKPILTAIKNHAGEK